MTSPASHEPFEQALSAGNFQRAGDWLVRRFASEVYGLCMAIVRDRATAEDLSQEVFAKAFASLDGFRGEASARTWLLAITRNRCIDHVRMQERRSFCDAADDPEDVADEPNLPHALLSNRREVDQALRELDEMERALIVLRFRNGLAYEELAEAFGLKTGTVRMRVSRVLAKMRSSLEAPAPRLQQALSKDSAMPSAPAAAPVLAPPGGPVGGGAPRPSRSRARPAPPAARAPAPPPSSGFAPVAPPPHLLESYFADAVEAVPSALTSRLASLARALPSGR